MNAMKDFWVRCVKYRTHESFRQCLVDHVKLNAVVAIELLDRRRKSFIVEHQAPLGPRELAVAVDLMYGFRGSGGFHPHLLAAIRRSCARLRRAVVGLVVSVGLRRPFPLSRTSGLTCISSFPGFWERSGVGGEHSYLAFGDGDHDAVSLAVDPEGGADGLNGGFRSPAR